MKEPEYILIRDVGPPHARIFTIRCKISNFEEDGTATTKKQAKHDAAKRMIDRIKGLVNNSNDVYKEKDEEDSSNASITTVDTELMNKRAEERYRAHKTTTRKINLGIKLAEYHVKLKDSLEDKHDKVLEQLEYIFPDEFFNNKFVTDELIMEKISELESVLSEIDVKISLKSLNANNNNRYILMLIELSTSPVITQIGMGRDSVEASWKALCQMIRSLQLLLS